jgi:hypothetical protein
LSIAQPDHLAHTPLDWLDILGIDQTHVDR